MVNDDFQEYRNMTFDIKYKSLSDEDENEAGMPSPRWAWLLQDPFTLEEPI